MRQMPLALTRLAHGGFHTLARQGLPCEYNVAGVWLAYSQPRAALGCRGEHTVIACMVTRALCDMVRGPSVHSCVLSCRVARNTGPCTVCWRVTGVLGRCSPQVIHYHLGLLVLRAAVRWPIRAVVCLLSSSTLSQGRSKRRLSLQARLAHRLAHTQ